MCFVIGVDVDDGELICCVIVVGICCVYFVVGCGCEVVCVVYFDVMFGCLCYCYLCEVVYYIG